VLVASKRARQIAMGAEALVEIDNDKPTVLALREISEGLVGPEILKDKAEELNMMPAAISADEIKLEM